MFPMTRSAYGFCHGFREAVRTLARPTPVTRRSETWPFAASRSRTKYQSAGPRDGVDELLGGRILGHVETEIPSAIMR
jgi:hypothetical protein